MALRLFHITEFAQSMLSPAAQREARHPARLILWSAAWIAIVGALPLWRELAQLPMDAGALLWSGLSLLLLAIAVLVTALCVTNWPGLLRLVILLALWVSACNTVLLWTGHGHLRITAQMSFWRSALEQLTAIPTWKSVLAFGLLALLPTVMIWRTRLRRVPAMHRLAQNLLLIVSFALLFGLVWLMARGTLLPLLQNQPRWLELLSPFNTLLSLRH